MLQTLTGGATTLSVQSSCLAEMGKTNSNTQLSRWIINYLSKQYTARQTTQKHREFEMTTNKIHRLIFEKQSTNETKTEQKKATFQESESSCERRDARAKHIINFFGAFLL